MRIVLDTNVFISAIFFGGVPERILTAWADGTIELILSPEILGEYQRVGDEFAARHPEVADALEPVMALLAMNASFVSAPPLAEAVSEDPADDKFLAAALASRTRIIVSGDKHLLRVSGWRGIGVLKPRRFVEEYL